MHIMDIVLLLFIIIGFLIYTSYKYNRERNKQRMFRELKGKSLEVMQILEEHGYHLVDYNCSVNIEAKVLERVYAHTFYVPMIVKKKKQKYIVYINKGKNSIRLSTKKVREHFLTLATFFKVTGVLIVELEKLHIRTLVFKI